jgi:hypothetical protein
MILITSSHVFRVVPALKRAKRSASKSKSLELKWAQILKEPRFKDWLTNLSHSNPGTAKDMARKFHVIYEVLGKSSQDLASMTEGQAQAFLIHLVDVMAKVGLKGHKRRNPKTGKMENKPEPLRHNTMVAYVNAVRTWLQHRHPRIMLGKIAIPDTEGVYDDETSPLREDLRKLIGEATKREKVAIALVAFSGARIEPLGDQAGLDGLEIRDFPEVKIIDGKVTFTKIPTAIIIRRSLAKRTHRESDHLKYGYSTFLNDEGCAYLQTYLEWRMKKGEILTPDTPIIPTEKGTKQKGIGSHMTTEHASDMLKGVVVKAGFTHRPYLLRRYFASQMQDAEADGLSIRDFRIFWMGHSGTIEEEYTQNKGRLPPQKIEKQREAYKRASDRYLTTKEPKFVPKELIGAEVVRVFLKGAKLKDEEISQLEEKYGGLDKIPPDEIPKITQEHQQRGHRGTYASGRQIIVAAADAREYLDQGYTYVATLPTNEIVLQAS